MKKMAVPLSKLSAGEDCRGPVSQEALLLHCAGVHVCDLSDALRVIADTTYAETLARLTAYFIPKWSREYET